jgi:Ca2+-dependent lipid-binding protein
VFRRRSQDEQAAKASTTTVLEDERQSRDPQAPKGRPTPKRSESQTRRRTAATVPSDRKAATKQAREARRVELAKQREALAGGDERYLPLRDRGPVRKFVRDYIDSRLRVAEFFLPLAVVILLMTIVQSAAIKNLGLVLWLLVIVLIVFDSVFTTITLRSQLRKRFPQENRLRSHISYGLMRTLQMRRLRLPKPQVKRGTKL